MTNFNVLLRDRDFNPLLTLPDLQVVPTHWGAAATGGPEYAIVEVYGPDAALWGCLDWLRYGVEIANEVGGVVWWGYVEGVTLSTPAVSVSKSLDEMSNSIKIEYGEGATGYSEDADSIAEYGRKQRVLSVDPALAASITQRQATELGSSSRPQPVPNLSGSEQSKVTLRCVGWLKTLGWTFYSRSDGLLEYVGSGSTGQTFGLDLTNPALVAMSSELWFVASSRRIYDTAMTLGVFEVGQQIVVTGSASNNTTYTVATATTAGPAGVTVNQLNWSAPHTIYRAGYTTAGEIAWLAAGDRVHITGAGAQSGWYHVTAVSGSWADMWFQVAETITGASTTTTTIWRGHSIAIAETPVEEKPGATVTLTVPGADTEVGIRVAQRFQLATAWTVYSISVKLNRVGSPADSVTLSIYSDSGSAPSSAITSSTVVASGISSNSAWTEFVFPVALSGATNYWIVLARTGALDLDNYYAVAVDEDAGYGTGFLRLWNGSAWVARVVEADMLFRVVGRTATTEQISEIVESSEFLTGAVIENASGIDTMQYRDGAVDALTELGDLLVIGTSNARRLLAAVQRDRTLRVWEEPAYSGSPDYIRRLDGQIVTPWGGALLPGQTIAGNWLRVETPIPPAQGVLDDPTLLFVERCEYETATRQYKITPRGAVNIWRLAIAPSSRG